MNGGDAGHFIYYVVLAALVGSGLIAGRRIGLGQAARMAGVWILVIAALLVLYSFRGEAGRVAQGVRADLFPAQGLQQGEARVYRRHADGHFHIEGRVNGVSVDFLVDTGASEVVLNRNSAQRVGIQPEALRFTGTASTANGTVRTARVRVDDLRVGPFALGPSTISINDGDLDVNLLGMSALSRFGSVTLTPHELIVKP